VDLNNKRNYFDRLVYKTIKGWVSVGDQRVKFQFEIPNFQRLLRLNLQVDLVVSKLVVKVTDADFDAKKVYYTECVKCK
jgi:ABC-type oligopeptide transport system substrate-binding subunit